MAPTIVLLHGFTHTGASWDPVVAALGQRYRVLAPDIRGHGARSAAAPVTLEAVLRDLDLLAPARFALAGYSMGGRIALHAALALAQRIERLILIGATPGIEDPLERAVRRAAEEALADQIEAASIEEFARRWARTPVLAGQRPEIIASAHADRLRNQPAGLARALRGLGQGALASLGPRIHELELPVELVVGANDRKFSEIGERMAGEMANARVSPVAGAGHAAHLEAPDRVAEILRATSRS